MHFGRNYTGIVNKPGMGVGGRANAGSRRERVAKDLELKLWPESAEPCLGDLWRSPPPRRHCAPARPQPFLFPRLLDTAPSSAEDFALAPQAFPDQTLLFCVMKNGSRGRLAERKAERTRVAGSSSH